MILSTSTFAFYYSENSLSSRRMLRLLDDSNTIYVWKKYTVDMPNIGSVC